jgi:prolycopene isomerase
MQNKYDAIIVGAGLGGLLTGALLSKENKKVLIVDSHNDVGGTSIDTRLGRFNFNTNLDALFLSNPENEVTLKNILKLLGLEIEFKKIPKAFRVITIDENNEGLHVKVELPFGVADFINKMEEYVPGSQKSMIAFFNIAKECKEALTYIANTNEVNYEFLENSYPNFVRISNHSLSKVLDELRVPLKCQEILNTYWTLLGSPETQIGFVHYATFLFDAINYELEVPEESLYDLSLKLTNYILKHKGVIKLNSKVKKIITENGKAVRIKLSNGAEYGGKKIITNLSPVATYKLVDELPKKAVRYINNHETGAKLFTIYLGLNRSIEEIGLDSYFYFLYHTLDSENEFVEMQSLSNNDMICYTPSVINPDVSPKGTSIFVINSISYTNEIINPGDYITAVDKITNNLLNTFTNTTGINLKEYIEEIKVITPVDYALEGTINGSYYGERLSDLDNLLPRLLNKDHEDYIENLYSVNGFLGDLYEFDNTYYKAKVIADKVLREDSE